MTSEITMSSLIEKLNAATRAYDEGHPIMSDAEWDNLYFALQQAEKLSGVYMEDSPTQRVIYDVQSALNKVTHNHKMLSLDKTKSLDEVNAFFNGMPMIAMSKMDGLTCSLKYEQGRLVSAETRGDGVIGEDVLHNAKVLPSIPKRIQYTETLVVDGEIICTYNDFEAFKEEYKNPRNFAAGSIRLLDAHECSTRKLTFVAWDVIQGLDEIPLLSDRLSALDALGFTSVPYVKPADYIADENLINIVKTLSYNCSYPIDGVVFKFNDVEYGRDRGETSHHFKNALAFKFYDETFSTTLIDIEWTMGRTGALTPVAIFKPIDIDGSTVERASLHNVSIMWETLGKQPWVGQQLEVYKANMIIPQIYSSEIDDMVTTKEYISIPTVCPVCGSPAVVETSDGGTSVLECSNSNCEGKLINRLDHFCGKKGLDIKGLSKATLDKLINWGWVNSPVDIFKLANYRSEWIAKPGFGAKSVDNLLAAIENSKTSTTLEAFISSIGIPLIGKTVAKELTKKISSYEEFREMVKNHFNFSQYDGFADSKTSAILDFDYTQADEVYAYMEIDTPIQESGSVTLSGKNFVITGKLTHFKNRAELVGLIESLGGKVVGSVSKNTHYLINNDSASVSAKNLSAQKLGIPVLTEQDFLELI